MLTRFSTAIFVFSSLLTAAPRAFTPEDLLSTRTIGEVRPSPDGKTILFTLGGGDAEGSRPSSKLMRISVNGGAPEPISGVTGSASNIRWSPDGKHIAYISNGVYVLDVGAGQAVKLCDYKRPNSFLSKSGNMLAWSPDGKQIAFAGTLEPEPKPQDPVVVTRILYKTRTAISDNRRTHIYVVPAGGGEPRQITQGNYDEHSIDWGGEGREIVFLSNRERDPDASLNYDIYAVNVSSGATRQLTRTPGVEMDPNVSPDGKWIAYVATKRKITTIDSVAEDAHLWVVSADGGEGRELNAALDRRTNSVEWYPDSNAILFSVGDHGKTVLYRTPRTGGAPSTVFDKQAQVGNVAVASDGTLAFTLSDPSTPSELYRVDSKSELRQLTNLNAPPYQISKPQTIQFKSFDGTTVEGFFYPALSNTGRMVLTIHGGPHGAFGYSFNPAAQYYASRGFAVLAINPRGSSGYGQKFSDGTLNNWGGGDYKDLMAGVDHVLKTHSEIDANKLVVTGGSYGGFMTNWVITQTNRFKAAVAVASVSDMISFYATSLYQDLVHAEFNGYPWDANNFATLWKWSPLAHVKNVTTPTMFLHGELDNDVHITQAEEMYTALRQRGIEAALVRYPREGHGFRESKHRLDAAVRTVDWFEKFVAK